MRAIPAMARAGALCLVFMMASLAPPAQAAATAGETPNDVARFLAGLEPAADSPLVPLTRHSAWREHARDLDAAWARLEKTRLAKVRAWSRENLTRPQKTVLYMFSGPDFLYVDAFFPDRPTYVMAGLEPVGPLPSILPGLRHNYGGALAGLRSSVGSALNVSFFITKKMKSSLSNRSLRGVLPVLYLFLARSGKTIHDVTLIGVDGQGGVVDAAAKDATPGVRITFSSKDGSGKDGQKQTVYYFQTDLSDGGVKRSGFLKFCEKLGLAEAFIKSASYLMHGGNFTTVRSFLLDHAAAVVQDDSGIPVRFFPPQEWSLHPHGRYLGPISIFARQYQRGLRELFRKNNPPRLEFGVGYRWRPQESNLLLARNTARESGGGQETAAQAPKMPHDPAAPKAGEKAPEATAPKAQQPVGPK